MEQKTVMGKQFQKKKIGLLIQILNTFGPKVQICKIPRRDTRTGQRYGAGSIYVVYGR